MMAQCGLAQGRWFKAKWKNACVSSFWVLLKSPGGQIESEVSHYGVPCNQIVVLTLQTPKLSRL